TGRFPGSQSSGCAPTCGARSLKRAKKKKKGARGGNMVSPTRLSRRRRRRRDGRFDRRRGGAAPPQDPVSRPPVPVHLEDRPQRSPRRADAAGELRARARLGPGPGRTGSGLRGRQAGRRQEPRARREGGVAAQLGAAHLRARRAERHPAAKRRVRVVKARPNRDAARRRVARGHRLDERHLPERDPPDTAEASDVRRHRPHRRDRVEVRSVKLGRNAAATDPGRRRRHNEDAYVREPPSLVAELVRSGTLSPEEAETHPQRSVVTRALGTDPDVDVDTFRTEAKPGDLFLLCSDGLTSMVGDDTILEEIRRNRSDLRTAAKALVRAANRGGGEDNITVVFFEIAAEGATERTVAL